RPRTPSVPTRRSSDLWTPGDGLGDALRGRVGSVDPIGFSEAEALGLPPESLDLMVSALAFQFVNDLPGVLAQIRRALKPDGLLLDRKSTRLNSSHGSN